MIHGRLSVRITAEARSNNPRPFARLPLWIGGAGEKRTLRTVARFADGWNAPYLAPAEWKRKNAVLDRWCDELGRDGSKIARTINLGFYMGADAKGASRADERYQREWGADARGFTGFLRGAPPEAVGVVSEFREAGVERLNIAVRGDPFDWDALAAFASRSSPGPMTLEILRLDGPTFYAAIPDLAMILADAVAAVPRSASSAFTPRTRRPGGRASSATSSEATCLSSWRVSNGASSAPRSCVSRSCLTRATAPRWRRY